MVEGVFKTPPKHGVLVAMGDTLYSAGLAQWLLEYPTLVRIRAAIRLFAAPGCAAFATANPLPEVVATLAGPGDEGEGPPV